MGELVTFTPKVASRGGAARGDMPATVIIFPGIRYEREDQAAPVPRVEERTGAEHVKA